MPLHVSVHFLDHLQGARGQYFMQLPSLDHYRFVQDAAVCHYHPFLYVYEVPDGVKPCHKLYDKVSPCQVLHIHTQTDGSDIRPHTAQIYNEHTSTDLML